MFWTTVVVLVCGSWKPRTRQVRLKHPSKDGREVILKQ